MTCLYTFCMQQRVLVYIVADALAHDDSAQLSQQREAMTIKCCCSLVRPTRHSCECVKVD